MTTIRATGDDKDRPTQINITINVDSFNDDPDEIARKIIKIINDYKRRHGGQDPLG